MQPNVVQQNLAGWIEHQESQQELLPGYLRHIVITEHSPELARIHEMRIEQRNQGTKEDCVHEDQSLSDWRAYRGLIASIINVAHADIQAATKNENPRIVRYTHRNRTKMLPNEAFDSAIEFFFGMRKVAFTDEKMKLSWGNHSSFSAYCTLMGWSAPRFRQRLLNLFPTIEPLVAPILAEGNWIHAPVAELS